MACTKQNYRFKNSAGKTVNCVTPCKRQLSKSSAAVAARSKLAKAGRACAGTGPIGGKARSSCLKNFFAGHTGPRQVRTGGKWPRSVGAKRK